MNKVVLLLAIIILSSSLLAQDSLYTNFNFSPFDRYDGNIKAGGDLNGDGYDDLVIMKQNTDTTSSHVLIYLGSADFDTIPDFEIIDGTNRFFSLALNGDLNGDGYDDLVISAPWVSNQYYIYGEIYIYYGGESFDTEIDLTISGEENFHGLYPPLMYGRQIDLSGDFNNDGYNDLFVASGGDSDYRGYISVFEGSTSPDRFDDFFVHGSDMVVLGAVRDDSKCVGDINGDGYDDLTIRKVDFEGDAEVITYPGTVDGLSYDIVNSFIANNQGCINVGGDFNSDGYNDITYYEFSTETLNIAYGNEDYSFDNLQVWEFNNGIYRVHTNDMNSDGYSDLTVLVPNSEDDKIFIYNGNYESLLFNENYLLRKEFLYTVSYYTGKISSDTPTIMLCSQLAIGDYFLTLMSVEELVDIDCNSFLEKNNSLLQNYPNPFNPTTKINYELRVTNYELAKIVVHNSIGQEVWSSKPLSLNTNHCTFEGSKFNSGIYYYSLVVDNKVLDTKAMILLK